MTTSPTTISSGGVGVVVPAAGSGTRLGEPVPKAFVDIGGRTILEACVTGIRACGIASDVVVVVPAELVPRAAALVPDAIVVAGGDHRSESVRAGLEALPARVDVVLIHDAARALTPPVVFDRVIDAVRAGHPVVVPGLPVADTLKRVGERLPDGSEPVASTVDRESLRAIQTPQGFTRAALRAAYANTSGLATDDAGLAEACGIPVHVVDGDPLALKITTPWDLRIVREFIGVTSSEGQV
ncbi:MAG: 2-C-methyl-D-erythritol 4-phosphate cytidylyltransferase [Gordonia sp. (in: high G+C Gram-positive bacteria)]